jgi:hypothetical protein
LSVSVVEKTALNEARMVVTTIPSIKNASRISIKVKPPALVTGGWLLETGFSIIDVLYT